ncbi:hypothetical protein SISNIDRAFT_297733 [Sistotremastrum niveocremeum HHB9708]|uniref:Uncharacterized protein n=2 Tax=Sistotremastraceae TaxID=3402574 RepID=A0A164NHQ7_9AGAM|nr:hypothetical protein SISNIDRAFT_297733 [Sistotremastrum niveocremeum HHB9708]KZT35346.1 hypothetical protein SISSUDRAFT_173340 [Sistotremastrum suecicum HHB10207 ss-3]
MSDFPVAIPPIPTSSISLPPMASTSTLTSCDPSPPSFYSSQSHQQPSSSTPYHSPSPTPSRDSPHPSQSQSQSKSQPGTGGRVDKKRLRSEKRLQVEKRSHLKKRDAGNQLVAYIKENVPQSEAGLVKGVADAATRAIEMMTDLKAHTKLVVSQLADSNTQLALELTRNRELSHRVLSLEALVRQYHMSSRRIPLPVRREEQVQVPKREEDCDGILTSTSSVRGESVKEEDVESKSNVL